MIEIDALPQLREPVLVVALGWTILKPVGSFRVTAYFDQAVGLYAGSDVRVLGQQEIRQVRPGETGDSGDQSLHRLSPYPRDVRYSDSPISQGSTRRPTAGGWWRLSPA